MSDPELSDESEPQVSHSLHGDRKHLLHRMSGSLKGEARAQHVVGPQSSYRLFL